MKVYIDPYMDRKNGVLKNKKSIKNRADLEKLEADFTSIRMKQLVLKPLNGDFDFRHLCKLHEAIFQDIYEWAGSPRIINIEKPEEALGGLSVEYTECDDIQRQASMVLTKMKDILWEQLSLDETAEQFSKCMADLWKVHPFREGNTRTIITFCCDFAESKGFGLDRELFKDNSAYMRRALVAASARFSDLGDLSKPEYLIGIVKDAIQRGIQSVEKAGQATTSKINRSTMRKSNSPKKTRETNRLRYNNDYFLER